MSSSGLPSAAYQLFASAGHHAHWGLSSSFDMIEAMKKSGVLGSSSSSSSSSSSVFTSADDAAAAKQPIRILLIEPGDIRHIITLISRRKRNQMAGVPIEIYLLENTSELLARDILLLELLNDFEVPIRQRATIFLEIFGNALVQERPLAI